MSETEQTNTYQFSEFDRVKLQQLLSLRTIALESTKEAVQESSNDSQVTEVLGEKEPWRLIPPNTGLYEWQEKCLKVWLKKKRGTVKVATGGGKTLFALAAAQQLQNQVDPKLKLAIVVPTIPLMNQWREELKHSNLHESQIGLLGGGNQLIETPDLKIIIAVLATAREKLPEIIKSLKWRDNLLLVVDECHRSNAKEAKKIYGTKPKYTLGLSATPEVTAIEDFEELEGVAGLGKKESNSVADNEYARSAVGMALGEIIFDFSLKECLDAGLLTKFDVYHVGLNLNASESKKYLRLSNEISDLHRSLKNWYESSASRINFIAWCQAIAKREDGGNALRFIGLASERKRLLYKAADRQAFTLLLLRAATSESVDLGSKAIVFHESIDEINSIYVEAIKEGLPATLEHSKLPAPIRNESIELFRQGLAKIIISAKSLVEGFNVPSADIGIIAASSSSVRQRIQSLGRMLRKSDAAENAKIFVLYISDTQDESIYEKADWEHVLGAERNRYFQLSGPVSSIESAKSVHEIIMQLTELPNAPRMYNSS